jgi:hypothetical protein
VVIATAHCDDEDGDPVTVEVTRQPAHGSVDGLTLVPSERGVTEVRLRYTPDPGFEGLDSLGLRGTDGHGGFSEFEVGNIEVHRGHSVGPDTPPAPASTPPPAVSQARAVSAVRQARKALKTSSVRLVRRVGAATVFAARKPPKVTARVRALAVVCSVRCRVDLRSSLGAGSARAARMRVSPGRAKAVVLRLSRAQRRRLKRSRRAGIHMRMTVRSVTGRVGSGRIALRLRR